jgi:hypothetical protein
VSKVTPVFQKRLFSPAAQFKRHNIKKASNFCTLETVTVILLQSALQPLVGVRPAQLSLSILSRKVLLSAVASCTSNPQLGGDVIVIIIIIIIIIMLC